MDTWQVWLLDSLTCLCTSFPSYQYVLTNVLHGSPYKHLSSTCIKPGEWEWEVIHMCVWFFDFPIEIWNCSDGMLFFVHLVCGAYMRLVFCFVYVFCFVFFFFAFRFVLFWTLNATIGGLNLSFGLGFRLFYFCRQQNVTVTHKKTLIF